MPYRYEEDVFRLLFGLHKAGVRNVLVATEHEPRSFKTPRSRLELCAVAGTLLPLKWLRPALQSDHMRADARPESRCPRVSPRDNRLNVGPAPVLGVKLEANARVTV